jgi:hypothetical protein
MLIWNLILLNMGMQQLLMYKLEFNMVEHGHAAASHVGQSD